MGKNTQSYKVPYLAKQLFCCLALVLLVMLVAMQVSKRKTYERLLVENSMQPEPTRKASFPAESVFELNTAKDFRFGKNSSWQLVHFWATWCAPCKAELPSLEVFSKMLEGEIEVYAVSVDDSPATISDFFPNKQPHFKLLWDKDKKLSDSLQIDRYPESFLLSPEGKIRAHFKGPREWTDASAVKYVSQLLQS